MKKRILDKTQLYTVVLLTLLNCVEGLGNNTERNFQPVPSDQMLDILTMISNVTQSNYDKIKKWQGKVDVTSGRIYEGTKAERVFKNQINGKGEVPKKVKRLVETTTEFAVNCEKGLFYDKKLYRSPLIYIDPNNGRVLGTKPTVGSTITVATPEYRITNGPFVEGKDVIIARQAVKEKRVFKKDCSTCKKDIFDPRYDAIDGASFRRSFLFLIKYIEKHGEFSIGGESLGMGKRMDGGTTEYRLVMPSPQSNPGEFVFTTMIFNSDKGFNITLSETRTADGKLYNKAIWEYEAINGVYLPTRTMNQTFQGESAELRSERECIYTNLKLNQAIPEETFTYKNLGSKNGDKFIDKIRNKEYTYQNGELIPIVKKVKKK
jgi:hypothetical protein